MVINSRWATSASETVIVRGGKIKMASSLNTANKLDWTINTEAHHVKGLNRKG